MRAMLAIAAKDLRLLVRDRAALFWALGFPVIFAVVFGAILEGAMSRGPSELVVSLVVEQEGELPARVRGALEGAGGVKMRSDGLETARRAVKQGEAAAYVRVGADGAEIGHDPTRRTELAYVASIVRAAASPAAGPPVTTVAVAAARGGYDVVYPVAILWGLLGCAGSFAVSLVTERARGTYVRLLSAPIGPLTILAGKALACFAACLVDAVVLTVLARVALGVPIDRMAALAGAILAACACFVGITVLLGALGESEQGVGGAGWATLLLMAMLGGGMVPVSVMPSWLRLASEASPVRWGITALEGVTWRGASMSELRPTLGALLGVGLCCFVLAALRVRSLRL